jgi:MYXO-CTERM domain-containing protein
MRRAGSLLAAVVAVAIAGIAAAPASAHIQVSPTLAAPNDAVRFTVLVPGERAPHRTDEVVLKVPAGVLPYSFGSTPGWRRTTELGSDGAVATITWKGLAQPDGFVEFSFLAATPPKPGAIVWKALQGYDDGTVVRWIGGPDSESPAPETEIRAGVPAQNAGGESPAAGGAGTSAPATGADSATTSTEGDGGGGDGLSLWLSIAALVLAGAALLVAMRRRA